jgi:hypothetical protein
MEEEREDLREELCCQEFIRSKTSKRELRNGF